MQRVLKEYTPEQVQEAWENEKIVRLSFWTGAGMITIGRSPIKKVTAKMIYFENGRQAKKEEVGILDTYCTHAFVLEGDEKECADRYIKEQIRIVSEEIERRKQYLSIVSESVLKEEEE